MVGSWANEILERIPEADRLKVEVALSTVLPYEFSEEPRSSSDLLTDVLKYIVGAEPVLRAVTEENGGDLYVYYDYSDSSAMSIVVVVYIVRGVIEFAKVYFFE